MAEYSFPCAVIYCCLKCTHSLAPAAQLCWLSIFVRIQFKLLQTFFFNETYIISLVQCFFPAIDLRYQTKKHLTSPFLFLFCSISSFPSLPVSFSCALVYFALSLFMHVLCSRYGLMYVTNSLRIKCGFANFYWSTIVCTKAASSASLRITSLNLSGKSLPICFTRLSTNLLHSSS